MCQQTEILAVCCSDHCPLEENNVRLPLLRLIPKPYPLYTLCDHVIRQGHTAEGTFLGIAISIFRPGTCPVARTDTTKRQICLSPQVSRLVLEKAANHHIYCRACLNTPYAEAVVVVVVVVDDETVGARHVPIGRVGGVTPGQRVQVEWTCCAKSACGPEAMCGYRAAATLSGTQGRDDLNAAVLASLGLPESVNKPPPVPVPVPVPPAVVVDLGGPDAEPAVEMSIVVARDGCNGDGCADCNFGRSRHHR